MHSLGRPWSRKSIHLGKFQTHHHHGKCTLLVNPGGRPQITLMCRDGMRHEFRLGRNRILVPRETIQTTSWTTYKTSLSPKRDNPFPFLSWNLYHCRISQTALVPIRHEASCIDRQKKFGFKSLRILLICHPRRSTSDKKSFSPSWASFFCFI